jgi:hypothetical protein
MKGGQEMEQSGGYKSDRKQGLNWLLEKKPKIMECKPLIKNIRR